MKYKDFINQIFKMSTPNEWTSDEHTQRLRAILGVAASTPEDVCMYIQRLYNLTGVSGIADEMPPVQEVFEVCRRVTECQDPCEAEAKIRSYGLRHLWDHCEEVEDMDGAIACSVRDLCGRYGVELPDEISYNPAVFGRIWDERVVSL